MKSTQNDARPDTKNQPQSGQALKQPVMGYAANKVQRGHLEEFGLENIWTLGQQSEDLAAAVKFARKRPGTVVISSKNGRPLGNTRKEVMASIRLIEEAKLTVFDIANPDDTRIDVLDRALRSAAGSPRFRDKRKVKRIASEGGKAAAAVAEARRAEIAHPDVICRMLDHPKLTKRDIAAITGIPLATLQRIDRKRKQ